MLSAAQIIHAHIGAPVSTECGSALTDICWFCGGGPVARGMSPKDWGGAATVVPGRVYAPNSPYVCEPCVYLAARLSPVPGRPPKAGQTHGGNWRNYSHVWSITTQGGDAEYLNFSKGDKPGLLRWLRTPKEFRWFCAIAESGQKHVLPWAPINRSYPGKVLFEETLVALPRDWSLVDDMIELLTAGGTKEDIERGEYSAGAYQRCAREIQFFESRHRQDRGSAFFRLALFLAQRDEVEVQARLEREKREREEEKNANRRTKGTTPRSRSRSLATDSTAVFVERPECSDVERPDGDANTDGSSPDHGGRGVEHEAPALTASGVAGQGNLFGDAFAPRDVTPPRRKRRA